MPSVILGPSRKSSDVSQRVGSDVERLIRKQAGGWQHQYLPARFGNCYTDSLALADDFHLLHSVYQPRVPLVEESLRHDEAPLLAITLSLFGESVFCAETEGALRFRAGSIVVASFLDVRGERRYCTGETRQLRLVLGESSLQRYIVGEGRYMLVRRPSLRQLACLDMTPSIAFCVQALLRQVCEVPEDVVQTHIYALSLLSEILRALGVVSGCLRQREKQQQQAEAAQRYLEANADRHVGLNELACAIGVSENKLRRLFAERYRQSPARWLLAARMHKARQLLERGCQVAEAAYAVGYEHPGNFSVAFSRFFGQTPKSVFQGRLGEAFIPSVSSAVRMSDTTLP